MTAGTIVAVVLAGGTSQRFGTDKLVHRLGARTLLGEALHGLPSGAEVIVVGPVPADRPDVRVVREEPVGGGPAAALVTGLRAALRHPFELVVVLPGDAPGAGSAAVELVNRLRRSPDLEAVLALDPDGREQPLQLALRPTAAAALVEAAGPSGGFGASARRLVHTLTPPPTPHRLSGAATFDIDTPAQLAIWLLQGSAAVEAILAAVRERADGLPRPVVVALAGPSAAGTSTLAAALALRTEAVIVLDGDGDRPEPVDLSVYVDPGPGLQPVRPRSGFDLVVRADPS